MDTWREAQITFPSSNGGTWNGGSEKRRSRKEPDMRKDSTLTLTWREVWSRLLELDGNSWQLTSASGGSWRRTSSTTVTSPGARGSKQASKTNVEPLAAVIVHRLHDARGPMVPTDLDLARLLSPGNLLGLSPHGAWIAASFRDECIKR